MKINRKMVLSVLVVGLGFTTVALGMEEEGGGGTPRMEGQITLVSADGQQVSISRGAAELSGTLKEMLEDVIEDRPVPLSEVSADTLQSVVLILERVKSELTPRKVDGKYAPYKVQPIVDEVLRSRPFFLMESKKIIAILKASLFLNTDFLENAVARFLVEKRTDQVQREVDTKDYTIIPKDIHKYLKKHLKLKAAKAPREYSIADLIEEHPEEMVIILEDNRKSLDLRQKQLTSLYGIERLSEPIYEAEALNLKDNYILDHERDPSFPREPFKKFTHLESLNLSDNQLSSLPVGIFNDLASLRRLYLSHNQLSEEQKAQIRAFFADRRVQIGF